jgi:hypothetical protein
MNDLSSALISRLVELFCQFPQVEAIALSGSRTSGGSMDPASDIDLYVFTTAAIPLEQRVELVERAGGATRADLNLDYWGPGDEWFDAATGIEVDVMYWDTRWIEGMLDRVLVQHRASLGYTTAFWHTMRTARSLCDRGGWLGRIREQCEQPFPEALRTNIIKDNLAVLRAVIPGYAVQIEKAVRRGDLVSVNHRVAALLASYFDVVFAYNRVLHPGEKRLLEHAVRMCPQLPENMVERVTAVLRAAGQGDERLIAEVNRLVDGVEAMVGKEGQR